MLFFGCSEDTSSARARVDGATDSQLSDASTDPVDGGIDDQMFAGDASGLQDMMWAPSDATGRAPDTNTPTATYAVNVTGGYGSGQYQVGDTVHVFAANNPFNEVVIGWTQDGLDAPPEAEWHLRFVMPANDVTLSPQIQVVNLDVQRRTGEGMEGNKRIFTIIPENARGLLFIFHGTGGSANIIEKPAARYLAMAAALRGYAVIVPEAKEVTDGDQNGDRKIRWDVAPFVDMNADLRDIVAYSTMMTEQGHVPADGPRVALGMSNGGAFSVTVGAALPQFEAVVSFCATGVSAVSERTATPTAWFMCENDNNETVSASRERWANGTMALAENGVRTAFDIHPPSPVYAGRFARIEGVNAERSAAAVSELAAGGWLDDEGYLTALPGDVIAGTSDAPADYQAFRQIINRTSVRQVMAELKAAYADHALYDDWATRCLDFMGVNSGL